MSYDWRPDFLNFTKTGEAPEAFLRELGTNIELQRACDAHFKRQVEALSIELRLQSGTDPAGQAMVDELFADIAHGDEKHRAWLKDKLAAWAPRFAYVTSIAQALHARDLALQAAVKAEDTNRPLRQRAERAEAACAQKHAALEWARRDVHRVVTEARIWEAVDAALASDCGKGWVSPEQHANVVREREEARANCNARDVTVAELRSESRFLARDVAATHQANEEVRAQLAEVTARLKEWTDWGDDVVGVIEPLDGEAVWGTEEVRTFIERAVKGTTHELVAVRAAAERVLDCAKRHPDRLECCHAMDALLRDALDGTTRCSCGLVTMTVGELQEHLKAVPTHRAVKPTPPPQP